MRAKWLVGLLVLAGAGLAIRRRQAPSTERVAGTEGASGLTISPDDRWLLVTIKTRVPLPPPSPDRPEFESLRALYGDEPPTTLVLIERGTGRRRVVDASPFDSVMTLDGSGVSTTVTMVDQFDPACWSADSTRCYFRLQLRPAGDPTPPGTPPPLTLYELDIADPAHPRLRSYQGDQVAASAFMTVDSGRGRCSDCWDRPRREVLIHFGNGTEYSPDRRFAYTGERSGNRATILEHDIERGTTREVGAFSSWFFAVFASPTSLTPDGRQLVVAETRMWGSLVVQSACHLVDLRTGRRRRAPGTGVWSADSREMYFTDIDRGTDTWYVRRWRAQ